MCYIKSLRLNFKKIHIYKDMATNKYNANSKILTYLSRYLHLNTYVCISNLHFKYFYANILTKKTMLTNKNIFSALRRNIFTLFTPILKP